MKKRLFCCVLTLALAVPVVAFGQGARSASEPITEEEDSDRPDWAGVPGNETKPGRPNPEPGTAEGDLYGDLYVIVRNANGEPVPYTWIWDADEPIEATITAGGFVQPIAYDPDGLLPAEFEGLVPLDIEGEIPEEYAVYAQEVDFGRLNLARAPSFFLDLAYQEALASINSASAIDLDPAGRLLLTIDGEEKTIDAPRENLALYRELMTNGYLTGLELSSTTLGPLDHLRRQSNGGAELGNDDLDRTASFLAGAADKFGDLTLDMVVYCNSFLGINDVATPEYFDFMGYRYGRLGNYGGVTAEVLVGPVECNGESHFAIDPSMGVMGAVFNGQGYDSVDPGAAEFAHAADDALDVIAYVHNWAVPTY